MNRSISLLLAFGLILSACDSQQPISTEIEAPSAANMNSSSIVPQDILDDYEAAPVHLVQLKGGIPGDFSETVAGLGGEVTFSHDDTGIAVVSGLSDNAATDLAAVADVENVVADATFEMDGAYDSNVASPGDATPASPDDPTTATRYSRQWDMRTISADDAWAAGRLGSEDVTIAILDTGIDYLYPDLVGRVDLARSASFVPFDDFLVSIFFPTRDLITDLRFHGTHVAMTASSNSNILAGVTSKTTLIGVKVCDVNGSCPFSSVIAGVLHAVDAGADVANMSLGGAFTKAGNGQFVGFINKTFNYANSRKMTIVVSAGNAATDLDHNGNVYATYCDTPNTMCVSATAPEAGDSPDGPWTNVDAIAPYTNYGSSAINVAAPGGRSIANSAGWVWSGCSTSSLVIPVCQTGVFILGASGTSMSSPHVSGLAALVVEDVGRNPGRIRSVIQNSADDLGKPGTDPFYGKGRINVIEALN